MDKFYVYRPLLDLIGITEGTTKGRGYNETLAYGAYTGGDVNLVEMTLAQIDALQTKMLQHPKNKLRSSALGMFQIIRTTRRSIEKALPEIYPPTRKFDKDCQDEMACYLLGVRGIDKYLAGRLKENTLINNLAQEWASLPTTEGKGHYEGQNTPITVDRLRQVLKEVRRRHAEGQPKETVEIETPKPVVPVSVEKEVREKTNWITTIFGAGGLLSGLASWAAGVDPDKLVLIGGIVLGGMVIFLLGGEWIIRRIRAIARAIEE